MGEGFQFIDIILFAMIAAFLVLRLRSVIGRRTGHQSRPADGLAGRSAEAEADANVIELPDRSAAGATDPEGGEGEDAEAGPADAEPDPLADGIDEIRRADPEFDTDAFLSGARSAFEMVVHAFATADTGALRGLLDDEVYANFEDAIQRRLAAAETLETTVVGIKSADPVEAGMNGRTALVAVRFVSEQVNVTRDAEGTAIDGDPGQVSEVTDIWTFARNTRSRDPNWKLIETRSGS